MVLVELHVLYMLTIKVKLSGLVLYTYVYSGMYPCLEHVGFGSSLLNENKNHQKLLFKENKIINYLMS